MTGKQLAYLIFLILLFFAVLYIVLGQLGLAGDSFFSLFEGDTVDDAFNTEFS